MFCQPRPLNAHVSLFTEYQQFVAISSASVASEFWAGEGESFLEGACFPVLVTYRLSLVVLPSDVTVSKIR